MKTEFFCFFLAENMEYKECSVMVKKLDLSPNIMKAYLKRDFNDAHGSENEIERE